MNKSELMNQLATLQVLVERNAPEDSRTALAMDLLSKAMTELMALPVSDFYDRHSANMKPSELCKDSGLSGLNELSEISGTHPNTLISWHENKRKLFDLVLAGATAK